MKTSVIALTGVVLAVSAARAFPGEYDANTLRAIGQGRALYLQHCASCHGPAAKGNSQMTFGTDGRTVSPLDLTKISARDGRFDAAHVRSHIEGRSWGKCAAGMPCWQQVLRASQQEFGATGQGDAHAFLQMWKLTKYVEFLQTHDALVAAR
jgi:mono/diheme cytochrome c family protein